MTEEKVALLMKYKKEVQAGIKHYAFTKFLYLLSMAAYLIAAFLFHPFNAKLLFSTASLIHLILYYINEAKLMDYRQALKLILHIEKQI